MHLQDLYNKLNHLESQKQSIEYEIIQTKKLIEKLSPFTKSQKIALFKSLFIAREDVYATYWINKEGKKKDILQLFSLLEEVCHRRAKNMHISFIKEPILCILIKSLCLIKHRRSHIGCQQLHELKLIYF